MVVVLGFLKEVNCFHSFDRFLILHMENLAEVLDLLLERHWLLLAARGVEATTLIVYVANDLAGYSQNDMVWRHGDIA